MVLYRRNYVPGGTYFFTVTLRNRQTDWLVRHVDALRLGFARVKATRPFRIDAMVVLPEHLHLIMTLPDDDSDYSGRLRLIKAIFARSLKDEGIDSRTVSQSRFWEHTIRDELDLRHHVDYITTTRSSTATSNLPPTGPIQRSTNTSPMDDAPPIGARPVARPRAAGPTPGASSRTSNTAPGFRCAASGRRGIADHIPTNLRHLAVTHGNTRRANAYNRRDRNEHRPVRHRCGPILTTRARTRP